MGGRDRRNAQLMLAKARREQFGQSSERGNAFN